MFLLIKKNYKADESGVCREIKNGVIKIALSDSMFVEIVDIVAYLARHNSIYKKLYAYPDYIKENFVLHMKDMHEYVTPRHIKNQPLGVWPIEMMEDGIEEFARDREVELHAVKKNFYSFTRETIIDYIKKGLEEDSPVAMLIGTAGRSKVTITRPDGSTGSGPFKLHWVIITELDEEKDKAKVKVSSWGGWGEVDLDEYIQNERLYQGLLYFK